MRTSLSSFWFTWVAVAFVLVSQQAFAGTLQEPNFTDTVFVSDATRLGNSPASGDGQVNGITSMQWAPDGSNRLYVTVKGRANANAHIQVINNGVLQSVPFYTFSSGVYTNNECGLESLVFHPDYATGTKQIYCFITVSNTEQRVVRFTETISGGNYVATGAPTTIISGIPTAGQNHNGGGLAIAPDQNGNGRFLYWACGNNGNGVNVGERLNNANLGCKIGRANLDGSTPTDGLNASGLIWAYGYRNPFTMTSQPGTGKLWVNVVGDGNEQIFIPTPGSWAGDNDFENFSDPGDTTLRSRQIKPIIKYRTNGTDTRTISTATRSGSTATYVTTSRHGFRKGEKITISGVSDATFNGTVYVLADVNDTTFTATLAGAGASGTGGSAVTQNLGGCITGGGFNDKGIWPAQYDGNFFFGDYNSGRITRVQLNGDNSVRQVDSFMTGGGRVIDVCFGPDGNLYYGIIDQGTIRKITYNGLDITTGSTLPASTVGVAYNQTLAVTGATAPNTWEVVTGSLPAGLSLNASTGAITGTPTAAGTSNFTVRVTDSTTKTGQKDFSITINAALAITTTSPLPNGTVGVAYSQTFAATGGTGTKTWSVSAGTLPGGVTLNTTGVLSGTPNAAGTFNFTVQVRDGVNATGSKAFAVTITTGNSAPTITSTAVTTGNSGVPYTYDVNASGNPAPTYSLTASPAGMTINATSGVITWTPGATVSGNFNVTVVASNGVNPNATQSFTINVLDYGLATRPAASAFLGLNPAALPATLSATNVFSNVANLTASSALIPYSVNAPLFSDNAGKARWIAVPTGSTIGFAQTGEWTFPSGTVLVKHFDLNTDERNPAVKKRLETRLLFVQNDGTMFGATYKWRADNTNADLLPDGLDENITITTPTGGSRTQTWHYPSRAECLQCHTQTAGGVLGVKTRQQNGTQLYPTTGVTDNQLRTWNHIGLFSTAISEAAIPTMPKMVPLTDTGASLEARVRSYIDSNCSHCHRPAGAPALFDARFDTPLASQNIINGAVNNEFGVAGSKVVVPQDLLRSLMHRRLNSLDATLKMPPLAKNVVDAQAVSVIEQWIGSLPPQGSGLYGVYYDNMDFTGTAVTRTDSVIDFDWGTGAPIAGIGADTFSVRWTGQIQVPTTGTYTFFTTTDDGVRLRVNGQLLVDKFVDQGPTEWSGTIALTAGQKYDLVMEYFENGGGAVARLNWSGPGITKQPIPPSVLYPVVPPVAPTNLIAAASSSTQINLTWTDNANNEAGYEIQRSPDGAAWVTITTTAANATSYSNTGLTAATTYHYRVRATNIAGVSAFAGPTSTTTMSGGGGPGTPQGVKVNFQLAGAPVPTGYVADTGAVFGDRGNGFSYGWNLDNSTTARDRNSPGSADQRYDTLEHLQKPENPNAVWEIALATGTYSVRVVSGDPSHIDSVFKMNVEGQLAVNGTPTTTQRWFEGTVTVNLTDGRLTITNGAGAANNKICFVDIAPVVQSQVAQARELGDAPADTWVFESAGETAISTAMLFTKPNGDALKVKARLPGIPADTVLAGQTLGVDVGGAVVSFTLDAKGRARSKQGSCMAKFDRKSGDLVVQLSVRKGAWNEAWADGGVDKTLKKADVVMPFVITFGERRFGGSDTLKYVGRKEKTGRAK